MKGNLAQLEPKMLGWWAESGIYERLLEKNAERAALRLPRRPALRERPPARRPRAQQGPQGHRGEVPQHGRPAVRLRPRLGLPRSAHRAGGGEAAQGEEDRQAHALPRRVPREVPRVRARVHRHPARRVQAAGRVRPLGRAVPDARPSTTRRRRSASWRRSRSEGLLYRRKKPVYWCLTDQTALAEAEVEYEDHASPSVYVAFDARRRTLGGSASPRSKGKKVAFVIWTTTPWTLPANLAIAVHPELEYVFYDSGARVIVRGQGPAAAGARRGRRRTSWR